jgi:hypothetical protein
MVGRLTRRAQPLLDPRPYDSERASSLDQQSASTVVGASDEPEEDVLGANVTMPKANGLAERKLKRLFGFSREPHSSQLVPAGMLGKHRPGPRQHLVEIDPEVIERGAIETQSLVKNGSRDTGPA